VSRGRHFPILQRHQIRDAIGGLDQFPLLHADIHPVATAAKATAVYAL
jgi:hypothetical protein